MNPSENGRIIGQEHTRRRHSNVRVLRFVTPIQNPTPFVTLDGPYWITIFPRLDTSMNRDEYPITSQTSKRRIIEWMPKRETLMDGLAIFNSLEAAFWMIVGVLVFRKSRLSGRYRRLGSIASVWFVLFGFSDVWEVFSGAWWRPWPLFALKASCIAALVVCGFVYRKIKV